MPSAIMIWTELVVLLALVVYLGTMVYCARNAGAPSHHGAGDDRPSRL